MNFRVKQIIYICCLLFLSISTYAQEELQHQLSIQHDNDFFFSIDRYYTAGIFIGYSQQLEGDFIFRRTGENVIQLDLSLGQETYTPRELFETNFNFLERPYAGYLFVSGAISKASDDQLLNLRAEFGLAGEQSLAGKTQIAYHNLINEFIPTWSGEIANSFHINSYGTFVKNYELSNSNTPLNVALESTAALGTRRVFARQEVSLYIGNRGAVAKSSAFGRLGTPAEFYGFASVGGEYNFLNALIQGHPWGDDSPFTLPIVGPVLIAKLGGTYRGDRNQITVNYNFRTKETEREGRSQFMSLRVARRW